MWISWITAGLCIEFIEISIYIGLRMEFFILLRYSANLNLKNLYRELFHEF